MLGLGGMLCYISILWLLILDFALFLSSVDRYPISIISRI